MPRHAALALIALSAPAFARMNVPLVGGGLEVSEIFVRTSTVRRTVSFKLRNLTGEYWDTVKLAVTVRLACEDFEATAFVDLGSIGPEDRPLPYSARLRSSGEPSLRALPADHDCPNTSSQVAIEYAENRRWRIGPGHRLDKLERKKEFEKYQAELAERAGIAIAEREAEEAEDQGREAEQKRIDAELAKRRLQLEEVKRQQVIAARKLCGAVYRATADRRISDLTVKEEQQVRACQSLSMYPPVSPR